MKKNNIKLIFSYSIIFVLLLSIIFCYGYNNNESENNKGIINFNSLISFSYPGDNLDFAGESVPSLKDNPSIKERFDKEFLNTSYNLYQLFLYIKRLPQYMPYIEEKLKEYDIPDDFKYLAIAESALRNDIISSAGAGGIWQFMPLTGKEHGLIVNDLVDERYNFEKSTISALEHINLIHSTFKNRTLTAAAYNRGRTGIKKAITNQKVDNYYDTYLNEETSRYVFRILAIKYVIKDYERNKDIIDKMIGGVFENPKTKTIKVGKIDDLLKWSLDNGYTYLEIKTLNNWILKNNLPEGNWSIKVPLKN